MVVLSDLIPESDLPGVPARNPCGEKTLHVAQEHNTVDTVVLTAGLLVEQHRDRTRLTHISLYRHFSLYDYSERYFITFRTAGAFKSLY